MLTEWFQNLRKNQPPFSALEVVIIFVAADIPLYVGKSFGLRLGLPEWGAFSVGLAFMAVCMIAYMWIRREPIDY